MKVLLHAPVQRLQQGIVSVIALLFLVSVVVFILMQSLSMSGSKHLEVQQSSDSVAALALAESGTEAALIGIANSVNVNYNDTGAFATSCESYAAKRVDIGRGFFEYLTSSIDPTNSFCTVRVKGSAGSANRTIQSKINFSSMIGIGGFGQAIKLNLLNPYDVPATAVFNLAWRPHEITEQGQAAAACTSTATGACDPSMPWNLNTTGQNAAGSLGSAINVQANDNVTVSQTLSDARSYSEVGLILGGYSGNAPTLISAYADQNKTTNTANTGTTSGTTPIFYPSNSSNPWCNGANTLVFGVSGRGDDMAAGFGVMTYSNQAIPMTQIAHFPLIPEPFRGIFSEIWYVHNPHVELNFVLPASPVSPTTINVTSTAGLMPGTIVRVYSGEGVFQANTKVQSVSPSSFTIDKTPTVNLASDAKICTGVCALLEIPSVTNSGGGNSGGGNSGGGNSGGGNSGGGNSGGGNSGGGNSGGGNTSVTMPTSTTFNLTPNTNATPRWASGFACFKGVDPTKIRRVTSSSPRVQQWHEVLNGE